MQGAVLAVLQHVEHVALAALLREHAVARQCPVLGVVELRLELADAYEALLATVAVGYIHYDECRDEQQQPYLLPHRGGVEDVASEHLAQCERGVGAAVGLVGVRADEVGKRGFQRGVVSGGLITAGGLVSIGSGLGLCVALAAVFRGGGVGGIRLLFI